MTDTADVSGAPATETDFVSGIESVFNNILTPGSSLNPAFQAIVDGCFAALFVVLLLLVFLTSGNPHTIALIVIELCLWASVKWFVNELKKMPPKDENEDAKAKEEEKEE